MRPPRGFTIVELLIVIVVIGILAALVISTFSNVQGRARDAQRKSDVAAIARALELYYEDKGEYPVRGNGTAGGSTSINAAWSTTADSSWQVLVSALKPYMGSTGKDPLSEVGLSHGSYNYAYYANTGTYCGAAFAQMYILEYRLEQEAKILSHRGECTTNVLSYGAYGSSEYRVVK